MRYVYIDKASWDAAGKLTPVQEEALVIAVIEKVSYPFRRARPQTVRKLIKMRMLKKHGRKTKNCEDQKYKVTPFGEKVYATLTGERQYVMKFAQA